MRLSISTAIVAALAVVAVIGIVDPQSRGSHATFPGLNGKIAFVRLLELNQGWGEIFVMDPDGTNQIQISNHPGFDEDPTWSPDGSKIAFTRSPPSGEVGPVDIWIMNADGGNQTNVTNTMDATETKPSWSPDGNKIVFSSDTLKIVDTTDLTVTDLGVAGHSPAWSPDGGRIVFIAIANPPGLQNVYVMNADGLNPVNIGYPGDVQQGPAWSPDGNEIAFDDSGELYVIDECGGTRYNLTHASPSYELGPAWSPDGAKIIFWTDDKLAVTNSDGSGYQLLATDAYFGGADWQPLVETPPDPVPRSHGCVDAAPTPAPPTPSPPATPTAVPIQLPPTGGATAGKFVVEA